MKENIEHERARVRSALVYAIRRIRLERRWGRLLVQSPTGLKALTEVRRQRAGQGAEARRSSSFESQLIDSEK